MEGGLNGNSTKPGITESVENSLKLSTFVVLKNVRDPLVPSDAVYLQLRMFPIFFAFTM